MALASSFTDKDDVLDARIVLSPHTLSRILKTSFLILKSSKTASMTKSVSGATFSVPTTPVIRLFISSTFSGLNILL